MNQIQEYMSNDLTEKGIESLSSLSKRTAKEGDTLKSELGILQNSLQDAQSDMSQSGISQK